MAATRLRPRGVALAGILALPTASAGDFQALIQALDRQVMCIESIVGANGDGEIRIGSGIQLRPGLVATVDHQVDRAREVRVYQADGSRSPARIGARLPQYDLALLEVAPRPGTVEVAERTAAAMGQEVFAIGCPLGLEHTLSQGAVGHPARLIDGNTLIQLNMPVNRGDSGAGVFDRGGNLLGLVHGTLKHSQGISFAIPVARLRELLDRYLAAADTPDLQRLWRDTLATAGDERRRRLERIAAAPAVEAAGLLIQARALVELERWPAARDRLLQIAAIEAEDPELFLLLGQVYDRGLGDAASARHSYRRFLALAPNAPQADQVRRWLLEQQGGSR